ncbi:hypothetical protein SAMN02745124_01482 [Desulfofustis glycolicus DSM 9705]|uniref:Uncharacterized protein n=1 Tax=Desulfofustis glycolicus DSM 9705 TaxID=1121409 RepID=A0A1M5V4U5_9BACT|nr:hypothetical protein SAMN02745124_01482 [Desulfofustis glycolicus DSM 9705]
MDMQNILVAVILTQTMPSTTGMATIIKDRAIITREPMATMKIMAAIMSTWCRISSGAFSSR